MPFDFNKPMFFDVNDAERRKRGFGNQHRSLGLDLAKEHRDRAFYCGQYNDEQINTCLHIRTCFNHLVGLPISKTTGKILPIFDYELYLFNDMEGQSHLNKLYNIEGLRTTEGTGNDKEVRYMAIKKSRGIGISEFFLRYMAWLGVCRNYDYANTRMFIVCGPGEATAIDLIRRLKQILQPLGSVMEDAPYNVVKFMGVEVYARPGAHVAALRGYENIKFILVDEAAFWTGADQAMEIRSVCEGYIAKSRPTIAFVSTPNIPGIMFEHIMEEKPDTCLYKRYFMPWTVGYHKVYTEQDIQGAKLSPNFEREMNLKFGFGIGNLFEDRQVDDIVIPLTYKEDPTVAYLYHLPDVASVGVAGGQANVSEPGVGGGFGDASVASSGFGDKVRPSGMGGSTNHPLSPPTAPPATLAPITLRNIAIGCDPAFGSSNASYVITAQMSLVPPLNKIIVLEAQTFERGSFRWFSDLIYDKYHEYNCTKIFIDSSQRDVVDDLKMAFREPTQYEQVQSQARQDYSYDPDSWMHRMVVVPIPFNKYGDKMLQSVVSLVQDRMILIPRVFEDLILDLRMAREKGGKLDKTGAGMDLFDSLRLVSLMYQYTSAI